MFGYICLNKFKKNNNSLSCHLLNDAEAFFFSTRLTFVWFLRHQVKRSDVSLLESGSHFITAVLIRLDCIHCKNYQRQNPDGVKRVDAWAYSSGHCRISHQVSSQMTSCSLTVSCLIVLETELRTWKATARVNIWQIFLTESYIIGWDKRKRRKDRGGLVSYRRGVVSSEASLSRVWHFAVVDCMLAVPVSKLLRTFPSLFSISRLNVNTKWFCSRLMELFTSCISDVTFGV